LTVTVTVSVPLEVPSLTDSVSTYVPADGNVTEVAAAFAEPNATPAGPLHVYANVDVVESSVAVPDNCAVLFGHSMA
jgi:hypothetical protein